MDNFDLFRLDGHTLRVFVAISETGSVSRAAEHFDLNQSTVSHTLDKMRAAIGDPLFVKSGRGITPTEKCLALLPRVQAVLAGIEGLVAPEDYEPAHETRTFKIGIPTLSYLPQMRSVFRKLTMRAPRAGLQLIRLAPRKRTTEMLIEGVADLAVAVSGGKYPAILNHAKFFASEVLVFYDPDCRGPVETIEDYGAARHGVAGTVGGSKSFVETQFAKVGLQRKVSIAAPTASMLADLIKGTDIITTMPSNQTDLFLRGLASCPPPVPLPKIEYDLLWHRRYEHSGRNKWLRDIVLSTGDAPT